ncbi:exodeoxyribonuclease V subunit alpha [Lacrimispora xylanisolvens]
MKKEIVKGLQKVLLKVSVNSVEKSIPATMYEREIPKAVLKKHETEAKNN